MIYPWPGNVREFKSTIRRAVLLADDVIHKKHLDIRKRSFEPEWNISAEMSGMQTENVSLREIVRKSTAGLEREVLTRTLAYTGGNKAKAARMLKIDYKTIHTKIKQLGIEPNRRSL